MGGTGLMGARGAVATSHALATRAGADALRRGGNAVDAAIAAAAVLCVVYPNNVALGGDLVALVREPSGRIHFVNATGPAPRTQRLSRLREMHGAVIPPRHIDAVTLPGGVRGWARMAGLGAVLDWSELLGPARELAVEHPLASSVARSIREQEEALDADPGCRALFLPGGRSLEAGEMLRQPALADTLAVLMAEGPDAFYAGALAERWVAALRSRGSLLEPTEVADFAGELAEPIRARAFGVEVVTSPPNTPGFALLRVLSALERQGIADPLGADADALARLFAEANAVRAARLADPATGPAADDLLAAAPPSAESSRATTRLGDTVGLVAVSEDGWAVSLVQSLYWPFGAALLDPGTGVLFQNRGTAFPLDPAHPGAVAGGRRPPHTLTPALVIRDGELAYAIATMGGQAQPQIQAQLLLRLLAGTDPAEAIASPRWAVGPQAAGDTAATMTVEADAPTATREALARAPLELKLVPARDDLLGHANVVRLRGAECDAASDPRSDGSAIVVEK